MLRQRFLPVALALVACGEAPPPEAAALPPPAAAIFDAPADAALPPPPVDRTIRRSVMAGGRRVGTVVTVIHFDGTRDSTFESVGDGPAHRVTSRLKIAPNRTLLSFDSPATDEHFFLEGAQATWKNASEQGTKQVVDAAFYVPLADDVDSFGLVAEALLAAGGNLALLPDGQAHAEQVGDTSASGANGATKHLVAWRITGLSLAPRIAWVDDAGAVWGGATASGAIVPEGWEGAALALVSAARAAEALRSEDVVRRLADHPPAAGLAITHARVLDVGASASRGRGAKGAKEAKDATGWLADRTVVIKGAKIVAVAPTGEGEGHDVPAGAETIDAGGKALLPGFWDVHARLDPVASAIYLASGITTLREDPHDAAPADKREDHADDVDSPWQVVAFRLPPQARRRVLSGYSDSIGGLLLPRSFELSVKGGASPADVLALATIGAARAAKVEKTSGSIAAGKDADLVLIDGDPLKDVGDVRYVVKVVRGGVVYDSAPLFESVGIQAAIRPTP